MKAVLKLKKQTDQGVKLYESSEELTPNDDGTINTVKQITAFQCPSCGALYEENLHIRTKCPTGVCGKDSPCCTACHDARLQEAKLKFEQQIILGKERLRLISESPRLFGDSWFMKLINKIRWLDTLSSLDDLEYRLEQTNAKQLPWKNSGK